MFTKLTSDHLRGTTGIKVVPLYLKACFRPIPAYSTLEKWCGRQIYYLQRGPLEGEGGSLVVRVRSKVYPLVHLGGLVSEEGVRPL